MRIAGVLVLLLALPAVSAVKPGGPSEEAVTQAGYCAFRVPAGWKQTQDWKSSRPGVLLSDPKSEVSIRIIFYKNGDSRYASLQQFLLRLEQPNKEVEKTAQPEKPATLDGRPAHSVHLEMLDLAWASQRAGLKHKTLMDCVAGGYPGGFYAVSLSAPQPQYPAASAGFKRFLSTFKLLVPASPPSAQ